MLTIYTYEYDEHRWKLIKTNTALPGVDSYGGFKPSEEEFKAQIHRAKTEPYSNKYYNEKQTFKNGYVIVREKLTKDNEFGPVVP